VCKADLEEIRCRICRRDFDALGYSVSQASRGG
jgi:hypothetical protein